MFLNQTSGTFSATVIKAFLWVLNNDFNLLLRNDLKCQSGDPCRSLPSGLQEELCSSFCCWWASRQQFGKVGLLQRSYLTMLLVAAAAAAAEPSLLVPFEAPPRGCRTGRGGGQRALQEFLGLCAAERSCRCLRLCVCLLLQPCCTSVVARERGEGRKSLFTQTANRLGNNAGKEVSRLSV